MKNPGWNDYLRGAKSARRLPGDIEERAPEANARPLESGLDLGGQLSELLGFDSAGPVEAVLHDALLKPVGSLIFNQGKRVRAQLVSLTYRLVNGEATASLTGIRQCRACAEVIELIHAGSLIVDDIEDGSPLRRGRPAMHVQYGLPLALNAGNWLYFWPYELLKRSGLGRDRLLSLYEHCHRTLLLAHFGQAIDLGARINDLPQSAVAQVCFASIKLKTGALTGLAARLGGAVAGASDNVLDVIDDFGVELGVALQMFDDLGDAVGKCQPAKRYEDLLLA